MMLHHLHEAVDNSVFRATGLQVSGGDFVAYLVVGGIIGDITAQAVRVRHHDGVTRRRLLLEMQKDGSQDLI